MGKSNQVSDSSSQPIAVLVKPIVPSLAYGSDISSIPQFQLCKGPTPCYKPLKTESFQAQNCTSRVRARLGLGLGARLELEVQFWALSLIASQRSLVHGSSIDNFCPPVGVANLSVHLLSMGAGYLRLLTSIAWTSERE